jgi:hypothetical protein
MLAKIAATNEKRRREFEELDEEMLSVGLGRGNEDTLNAVSKSSRQLNKPPQKIASEVALLARSMIEMNKTLHAVVMNQQASKKLNLKNKRQKQAQQRTKNESHVIDERLRTEDRKSGDTHQYYGDVDAFEKRYNKKRDGMIKNWIDGKKRSATAKKVREDVSEATVESPRDIMHSLQTRGWAVIMDYDDVKKSDGRHGSIFSEGNAPTAQHALYYETGPDPSKAK